MSAGWFHFLLLSFQRLHRTISIPVCSPPPVSYEMSPHLKMIHPRKLVWVSERGRGSERGSRDARWMLVGRDRRAEYAAFLHSPGLWSATLTSTPTPTVKQCGFSISSVGKHVVREQAGDRLYIKLTKQWTHAHNTDWGGKNANVLQMQRTHTLMHKHTLHRNTHTCTAHLYRPFLPWVIHCTLIHQY